MKTAVKEESGVELRPLEVTLVQSAYATEADEPHEVFEIETAECECGEEAEVEVTTEVHYSTGRMDAVFEALRRRGIDIGREFSIHVDQVTGIVTARQDPWVA